MQRTSLTLAITAVALAVISIDAGAQGQVSSRPDDHRPAGVQSSRDDGRQQGAVHSSRDGRVDDQRRGDVYDSRRGSDNRVTRGHMPPRGMCRVWLEGVPAGRQPRITGCETALRNRPVNGRVLFGNDGITRSDGRHGQYTVYRVLLNNRRCEVRERFDRYGRAHYERRCEQSRRASRDGRWGDDPYRRDERIRFGDWYRI
jgi:hypothetical protein